MSQPAASIHVFTLGSYTCFEQPLSERARTFLRLEHLFAKAEHHYQDTTEWGRRAHLLTLLDILTLLSRNDMRNEIVKELGEQHNKLRRYADHPDINQDRLHNTLIELDELHFQIQQLQTQHAGSLVRDNNFLNSVMNRSTIAGGSCSFDLPGYHLWLSRPPEVQERNITAWSRNLELFERSVELILRLLRTSAEPTIEVAENGIYQQNMKQPYQLIRVMLPEDTTVFPEISGGKHRCTIRFMQQDDESQQTLQVSNALRFQLCCCLI